MTIQILPSHPMVMLLCRIGLHRWSEWFEPVGVDFNKRHCLRCWKRETQQFAAVNQSRVVKWFAAGTYVAIISGMGYCLFLSAISHAR